MLSSPPHSIIIYKFILLQVCKIGVVRCCFPPLAVSLFTNLYLLRPARLEFTMLPSPPRYSIVYKNIPVQVCKIGILRCCLPPSLFNYLQNYTCLGPQGWNSKMLPSLPPRSFIIYKFLLVQVRKVGILRCCFPPLAVTFLVACLLAGVGFLIYR